MPAFGNLMVDNLVNRYGSAIDFVNCSEGGMAAPWGLENIDRVLPHKPDLAIIAWGMNDASERIPTEDYIANIKAQMDAIRAVQPEVEFILMATMTANPDWVHYAGPLYGEYLTGLLELQGPSVAVADVTSVWTEVLKHKRFFDLIANGVNHPNDFGHRLYAQVLLSLLIENYS